MRIVLVIARFDPLSTKYGPSGDVHRFFQVACGLQACGLHVHIVGLRPFEGASIRLLEEKGFSVEFIHGPRLRDRFRPVGRGRLRMASAVDFLENDAALRRLHQIVEKTSPEFITVAYLDLLRVATRLGPPVIYDAQEIQSYVSRRWEAVAPRLDAVVSIRDAARLFTSGLGPESLAFDGDIDAAEIDALRGASLVLCPSRIEIQALNEALPGKRIVHLPIMAARVSGRKASFEPFALYSMGPNPFNLLGYYYFLSEVVPKLGPDAIPLTVTSLYKDKPALAGYGIELRGRVTDAQLCSLTASASFFASPVYFGIGMQVKVMQALANGLPVLTMRSRFQDIVAEDGECGYIVDDATQMADRYRHLSSDPTLLRRMSDRGRELVATRYSAESCALVLREAICSLKDAPETIA